MDRIAVFGDVHGCVDLLKKLLAKIEEEYPGIPVYSTGDLIDRGPSSKEVVDLVIEKNIQAVRGNHDDLFDIVMNRPTLGDMQMHLQHGMKGLATANSYSQPGTSQWQIIAEEYRKAVPQNHKSFFRDLPFFRIVYAGGSNYLITHAGLSEYSWLDAKDNYKDDELELEDLIALAVEDSESDILWNHKTGGFARIPGYTQILGHRPVLEPLVSNEAIMIDTGCGHYDHPLTAVILPDMKFISVHPDSE